MAQGADSFTAGRRALARLYQETVVQAQVLSYGDDFWLLGVASCAVLVLVPFMRRVRADPPAARPAEDAARDPGLPAPAD